MFVMYEKDAMRLPVKVWLEDKKDLEETCREQAYHLAQLPFLHKWVNLMPDTHAGMGMPIGGVIAAEGVIIPNAVGVDIGCGMAYTEINIPLEAIREIQTGNGTLIQAVIGDIMRNVPVGFAHHKLGMPSYTMDRALEELNLYEEDTELLGQLEAGYFQIGTLGGGNHFIELQEDDQGMLAVMIHSGSRHFGKSVCDYFHYKARQLNQKWYSQDLEAPLRYIEENREKLMLAVKAILEKYIGKYTELDLKFSGDINCHHNYASLETHYGKEVWVHRKGAVRAENGELAVIPGAMGSYSYVVMGKGNQESFCSCSHGAGRKYSRKGAMEAFSCEDVILDLRKQGVVLGKKGRADVAEESRFAYKDIDQVMNAQTDLVTPVKRLKTVGVVKG